MISIICKWKSYVKVISVQQINKRLLVHNDEITIIFQLLVVTWHCWH